MIYTITTGVLTTDDGEVLLEGCYAGGDAGKRPEAVNNPAFCSEHDVGPLPPGLYAIETIGYSETLGPAMALTPDPTNTMYGRSGFYFHYQNRKRDAGFQPYLGPAGRNSSDGCIVVTVWGGLAQIETHRAAGDNRLTVQP